MKRFALPRVLQAVAAQRVSEEDDDIELAHLPGGGATKRRRLVRAGGNGSQEDQQASEAGVACSFTELIDV